MYLTLRDMKFKKNVDLHQLQYSDSPKDEKSLSCVLIVDMNKIQSEN